MPNWDDVKNFADAYKSSWDDENKANGFDGFGDRLGAALRQYAPGGAILQPAVAGAAAGANTFLSGGGVGQAVQDASTESSKEFNKNATDPEWMQRQGMIANLGLGAAGAPVAAASAVLPKIGTIIRSMKEAPELGKLWDLGNGRRAVVSDVTAGSPYEYLTQKQYTGEPVFNAADLQARATNIQQKPMMSVDEHVANPQYGLTPDPANPGNFINASGKSRTPQDLQDSVDQINRWRANSNYGNLEDTSRAQAELDRRTNGDPEMATKGFNIHFYNGDETDPFRSQQLKRDKDGLWTITSDFPNPDLDSNNPAYRGASQQMKHILSNDLGGVASDMGGTSNDQALQSWLKAGGLPLRDEALGSYGQSGREPGSQMFLPPADQRESVKNSIQQSFGKSPEDLIEQLRQFLATSKGASQD